MSELFERLESEAERESLAQTEDRQLRYDQPVAARVAAGLAIDGLHFQATERGAAGGETWVFVCRRNDSRLRPGTRGRLSRGDPRRPAAHVEVLGDAFDGRQYLVRLAVVSREAGEDLASPEPWVLDEDQFDLLDLELAMLRRGREAGLGAWVEGGEPVRSSEPEAGLLESPYAAGLAGSLATAFREASTARNWYAVQGPPGTGKTHLLSRLALDAAARQGLRVLVTAVSHQAIHNALAQCYWLAAELQGRQPAARELVRTGFYKLGSSKALLAGLPVGVRGARRLPKRRALVAGATLYSLFSAGEEPPPFDLVLFDESGQARLPLALGARAAAPRAIFIGDDRQLPPVVSAAPEAAARPPESILSLVRRRYGAPFLLTETRRLNAELCRAVSESFYDGRLEPSPQAAERRLALARPARSSFAGILEPGASLTFVDVPHAGCRSVAEAEARWAAALAAEALRCGVAPQDLGVISPFRAQCNRIRFLLQSVVPAGYASEEVLVSTVERFQGQERELVLLSLAASQPAYVASLGSFLFSANRLNVAVSRARTKVVVLGSHEVLSGLLEGLDPDQEPAAGWRAYRRLRSLAASVRVPLEPPGLPPAEPDDAARRAPEGFAAGHVVEHPDHGVGVVLAARSVPHGAGREEALEVRFADGRVRTVVPRLCSRPLRLVTKPGQAP
ncbi:MAG: ATP-binding protein [Elusimicrobia bacterium]|nr:ATP-binding protein [Elusimicrobiota bacterium]